MNRKTVVYDVTPISYAQCGLCRQFHRGEKDVQSNIVYLHCKRFGTEPPIRVAPNRYIPQGATRQSSTYLLVFTVQPLSLYRHTSW